MCREKNRIFIYDYIITHLELNQILVLNNPDEFNVPLKISNQIKPNKTGRLNNIFPFYSLIVLDSLWEKYYGKSFD